MNVALCQMDIAWEDKQANFRKVRELLARDAVAPGSLLVLPEMFATGFSMSLPDVADCDGSTAEFLRSIARERGIYVIAGVTTLADSGRGSNNSMLVAPSGELRATYRKMRPFVVGEKEKFVAGNSVVVTDIQDAHAALFVCFDLRFPELFRRAAREGVHLITVIANWPEARIGHWVTLLQARAIENQSYVAGVNRVGDDPTLHYTGRSMLVGPDGEILLDAGGAEGIFQTEIDLDLLAEYRRKLPFLAEMGPE